MPVPVPYFPAGQALQLSAPDADEPGSTIMLQVSSDFNSRLKDALARACLLTSTYPFAYCCSSSSDAVSSVAVRCLIH